MKNIKQSMVLTKTTPGTYRYDCHRKSTVVPTVYIKKAHFNGAPAPARIMLMIEPLND